MCKRIKCFFFISKEERLMSRAMINIIATLVIVGGMAAPGFAQVGTPVNAGPSIKDGCPPPTMGCFMHGRTMCVEPGICIDNGGVIP